MSGVLPMIESTPPRLSDLVLGMTATRSDKQLERADESEHRPVLVLGAPRIEAAPDALMMPGSRRAFLARASTLSLALPGLGAALAACAPDGQDSGRDSGLSGAGSARDSL